MTNKTTFSNSDYLQKLKNEIHQIQNLIYNSHSITITGVLLTNTPLQSFEENVLKIIKEAEIHPFWIKKIIIPHNNYEPTKCFVLHFISYQTKLVAKQLLCSYMYKN